MSNEPVRKNLYAAAAVVAVASVLAILGVAEAWTPQVVATAAGVGLGEFAAIAWGVERARQQVWGPESVKELTENLDAEMVLRQAEADGES